MYKPTGYKLTAIKGINIFMVRGHSLGPGSFTEVRPVANGEQHTPRRSKSTHQPICVAAELGRQLMPSLLWRHHCLCCSSHSWHAPALLLTCAPLDLPHLGRRLCLWVR